MFKQEPLRTLVDRTALPDDPRARQEVLGQYFGQITATSCESPDGWLLELGWPKGSDYYVDPGLAEGLEWWGASIAEIPYAHRFESGFLLTLNDSWSLLSWSKWLAAQARTPEEVVILHVDDHDDMMCPRLAVIPDTQGTYKDLITGEEVRMDRPETVANAIVSSAIGIGSFITPMVHSLERVHIRHLCATYYSQTRIGLFELQRQFSDDSLLAIGSKRPVLNLNPASSESLPATYKVTSDCEDWLSDLPPGPILLHIDMDYFNNRFNGDSDWESDPTRHDPSREDVMAKIGELFENLSRHGLVERIEDVTVALSPGFFPAEFWAEAIERIRAGLHHANFKGVGPHG